MRFYGLIILTEKKFSEEIAAAKEKQRKFENKLVSKLLFNAEHYRMLAKGLLGREVKLPRRP